MIIDTNLILLIVILVVIIVGLIIVFSPQKTHTLQTDLISENMLLRHKITTYERKLQVFQKIYQIFSRHLPNIFQTEELIQQLNNYNLTDIGISEIHIFLLKEKIFSTITETDSQKQALAKLLYQSPIIDSLLKGEMCTKDQIMIKNLNMLSEIQQFLPEGTTYFTIHPIRTGEQLIGAILITTALLPSGGPDLFVELSSILAFHLGYLIYNSYTYKTLLIEQQELKQAIFNRTKELEQAVEQISEISKSKSEIISTVAHEMRTALTSIKGFASLIHSGKLGEISPEAKKRLERIVSQVDRLTNMVNTLLDINKIDAGKIEMKPVPINLRQIANQVIDSFLSQIDAKKIITSVSIPENITVIADPVYIERLLSNLISNAIKFTPQNGEIHISAIPLKEKEYILLTVKDTGVGIPENEIEHIFKEFYHIDHPNITDIKGVGLGLPLVKRIVEAHKGKIWVKSQLNKGTTFYIELPGTVNKLKSEEGDNKMKGDKNV